MTFPAKVADIRLSSRSSGVTRWQILLEQCEIAQAVTVATLTARSANGAVLVAKIVSSICDGAGNRWLVTEKPLPVGTEVEVSATLTC